MKRKPASSSSSRPKPSSRKRAKANSVRVATLRDFADLARLNATLDGRDVFSRPRLRYLLHNATVLMAHRAGIPAGFCIVVKRGKVASVHAIAVERQHRRRGIGSMLLRAATKRFRTLRCEIRASNVASEQLFSHAGFTVIGVKPGVYADGEAGLKMQLL